MSDVYYDCNRDICLQNQINHVTCEECVCRHTEKPLTDYERGKADAIEEVLKTVSMIIKALEGEIE